MTLRVLILCQRKSSTLPKDKDHVDKTVEHIETYIDDNFGHDVDIEYLTTSLGHQDDSVNETNYYADYKFALDYNEQAINFVAKHKGVYDGIILNTCPLKDMNYTIINQLLKPGGFLLLKTFAPQDEDGEIGINRLPIHSNTLNTLDIYFTRIAPGHISSRLRSTRARDYGSRSYLKTRYSNKKTIRRKLEGRKVISTRRNINSTKKSGISKKSGN
jgi:hypothetical protein